MADKPEAALEAFRSPGKLHSNQSPAPTRVFKHVHHDSWKKLRNRAWILNKEWSRSECSALRRPGSKCARDHRSAGVSPIFISFLFSLLLAQTSYGISKIGSSFLNSLLSAQCSVGLVDWLKSLISWANTSWPFGCRRVINWEDGPSH